MFFKIFVLFSFIFALGTTFAQGPASGITDSSLNSVFTKATKLYSEGRYEATARELSEVEKKIIMTENSDESLGLLAYWQGIVANRLNEFPDAIKYFDKAINLKYKSDDINYEINENSQKTIGDQTNINKK